MAWSHACCKFASVTLPSGSSGVGGAFGSAGVNDAVVLYVVCSAECDGGGGGRSAGATPSHWYKHPIPAGGIICMVVAPRSSPSSPV